MSGISVNSVVVIVVAILAAIGLFLPRVVSSDRWRATVTPLASIIGSGFLILAPLLGRTYGHWAVAVMAALCLAAYGFGAAIRFNILALDGRARQSLPPTARLLDRAASWALASAYVISVTYYLRLFGSFAVSLTAADDAFHGQLATTAVLIFVGGYGFARGLRALENLEEVSVSIKLAIIAGLLAGLAVRVGALAAGQALPGNGAPPFGWGSITLGFGLLITVQGFETSRYLGAAYDAPTRVATMRRAQFIASAIYIVFIGLATLAFPAASIGTRETAVIQMTAAVAPVLPILLVVAALASQFSAAVADTNGCGGLIEEISRRSVSSRRGYLVLTALAVALVWSADVFEIISYASRAFAAYYALQAALATLLALRSTPTKRGAALLFAAFAVLGVVVAALGTPAEQ